MYTQVVEGNPCLSYVEMVIFAWFGKFEVTRSADNGGDRCASWRPDLHGSQPCDGRVYTTFGELCEDYKSGGLHPGDLKPALSRHINMILQPVRDHFTNDPHAAELLKKVKVCLRCMPVYPVP